MSREILFAGHGLPAAVVADLRRMNPWWEGKPQRPLPGTRRHLVRSIQRRVELGLAPIVVLRGPRQIGKTTAMHQVIEDLLSSGVEPRRIFAVQFDELRLARLEEPILRLVEWYERAVAQATLNELAHGGRPAYILFDEVQNLEGWAPQLKSLVDHAEAHLLVTGSSALRIEAGRDSLAGRITTIEAGVLSLTEIAHFHGLDLGEPALGENGLDALRHKEFWQGLRERGAACAAVRDRAFRLFSERGGYPLMHRRPDVDLAMLADQLNENVIRRVIQHDLRLGERGRKLDPQLLEELFRLCCRYAGQAPSPGLLAREVNRVLNAGVGDQRVRRYLRFLEDTLLVRLVPPLELRLKRSRGAPKICLADHALRASWLQDPIPLDPGELRERPEFTGEAGHLAESVLGALFCSVPGLDVAHFPERKGEPEVDFVLTLGQCRLPIEVKYQRRLDPLRDTEGLRAFIERSVNRAPFGILVTQTDDAAADDPRIVTLPLSTLLLLR
jgi:predicted AAA+ superfamily ATPase